MKRLLVALVAVVVAAAALPTLLAAGRAGVRGGPYKQLKPLSRAAPAESLT